MEAGNLSYHHAINMDYMPPDELFSVVSGESTADHLFKLVGPTGDSLVHALQVCYHPIRLYVTRSHLDIYTLLGDLTCQLADVEFASRCCCNRAIVGFKMVGKTFALRAFARAIPLLVPRIMVVYASMRALKTSISEFVAKQLNLHFCTTAMWEPFEATAAEGRINQWIIDRLVQLDWRLLLIVDEMDHLYMRDRIRDPGAVQALRDLASFGDQTSGRVSTVLCGPPVLLDLMNCVVDPTNPQHFALLATGAVRLHWTKFITYRVPTPLPTDLAAAASILGLNLDEENHLKKIRAVAFVSGCTISEVGRALQKTGNFGNMDDPPALHWDLHAGPVLPLLAEKLYKKLHRQNKQLCKLLFTGTAEQIAENIQTCTWEKNLTPVSLNRFKKEVQKGGARSLQADVSAMAELGWITLHETGHDTLIYPASLQHLMKHSPSPGSDQLHQVRDILQQVIQSAPQDLAEVSGQPKVVAAVAALGESVGGGAGARGRCTIA